MNNGVKGSRGKNEGGLTSPTIKGGREGRYIEMSRATGIDPIPRRGLRAAVQEPILRRTSVV